MADVGLKQRPAGFETLDAAAEHHVGPWCVLLLLQLLKQFVCAALYDLDPDSGARFKFLDDRPPDLFFVRGVQNETLRFIRRVGGCILCGGCVDACPVNAISGVVKKPYTIDSNKCIKCGACKENCAFDAIYIEA